VRSSARVATPAGARHLGLRGRADEFGRTEPWLNVMLHAPAGTVFPSDKSDYYVVPLCNTRIGVGEPALQQRHLFGAFVSGTSTTGSVRTRSITPISAGHLPAQRVPSSGGTRSGVHAFRRGLLERERHRLRRRNTFGIFIADVVNPPALPQTNGANTPYPAQSFNVTTSQSRPSRASHRTAFRSPTRPRSTRA